MNSPPSRLFILSSSSHATSHPHPHPLGPEWTLYPSPTSSPSSISEGTNENEDADAGWIKAWLDTDWEELAREREMGRQEGSGMGAGVEGDVDVLVVGQSEGDDGGAEDKVEVDDEVEGEKEEIFEGEVEDQPE